MKRLLGTTKEWKVRGFFDRVIHILSCDGAGRDDWKKHIMGSISFSNSDFTIITTDNYDENDNPQLILDLLSKDLPLDTQMPNLENWNESLKYTKIINRQQAMQTALLLAQKMSQSGHNEEENFRVLIVSTGIGSEQVLIQPYQLVENDERKVWVKLFEEFQK
jgi:hypothetical protein